MRKVDQLAGAEGREKEVERGQQKKEWQRHVENENEEIVESWKERKTQENEEY